MTKPSKDEECVVILPVDNKQDTEISEALDDHYNQQTRRRTAQEAVRQAEHEIE
ncbi:hypothetical protein [Paenibacillus nasutitermitis]|uniref:Uncharacterized protein n=1 Tax=Paenibacillus nasutitermitis TaxID=1652958 RepID=A0A917DV69_9BACL|nr:hypothetical protein [Paenibacillus nasutitermitis]GGD71633.1 hypothetical protein GCM10010911_31940 [Paenibacillus nasutitermitis]